MMQDPANKIIMQAMGLGIDNQQRVIDQDTRDILKFKDKNIKYSSENSVIITKNDIQFDPIGTRNQMSKLFDHFTEKIENEDGTYVSMYYDVNTDEGTALQAIVNGEKVTSNFYKNEALRYLDVVLQINGSSTDGLSQYDVEPQTQQIKKKKGRA